MKTITLVVASLICLTCSAMAYSPEDRPNAVYTGTGYVSETTAGEIGSVYRHHRAHRRAGRHHTPKHEARREPMPTKVSQASLIARMRRDLGTDPTGWGHQWCGNYLCRVVHGGNCARSKLNLATSWKDEGWRAPAGAVGSVAVMTYHVGVVTGSCPGGGIKIISGNHNHVVGEGCYPRHHIIAYRWLWKPEAKPSAQAVVKGLIFNVEQFLKDDVQYVPRQAQMIRTGPFVASVVPEPIRENDRQDIFERDEINSYLWTVYQRTPKKVDNTGDFTWKDKWAAEKMKKSLAEYVIGGMSPEFKRRLYKIGKFLDAKGIRWSILSAFRDDRRQRIAAGIKACTTCSLHGGSAAVGGYGHGVAVDVTIVGDEKNGPQRAGAIFARYASQFDLSRPYPGFDPAHIQQAHFVSRRYASRHAKKRKYYAKI